MHKYKNEAKNRWGHTKAYKQSISRTKSWNQKDFDSAQKQMEGIVKQIADKMNHKPSDQAVQKLIQKHFEYIQIFYDCDKNMYKNLADLYVSDQKFKDYFESIKPGLSIFMKESIYSFCKIE